MDILVVYPKLDLDRPVGMDKNRLLLLERLSRNHDVDIWVTANGPKPGETGMLENLDLNVLHTTSARVGQSKLLAQSLIAKHVPEGCPVLTNIPRSRVGRAYDVVHIETAGLAPLIKRFSDRPVVWSLVDSPSYRKKRLYKYNTGTVREGRQFVEWKVAQRLESKYGPYADVVHVVSEREASYLNDQYAGIRARAIPVALPETVTNHSRNDRVKNRVAVLGNRDVPYIREGISEYVLPAVGDISEQIKDLQVVLLGRGTMEIPERYSDIVHQPGWVDEYIAELTQASVAVIPDPVGSGIKNRTVQSLALGLPVAGTRYAFEGIDIDPNLVGGKFNTPRELRNVLETVLTDATTRELMGERGRAFVTDRFDPDSVTTSWIEIYQYVSR